MAYPGDERAATLMGPRHARHPLRCNPLRMLSRSACPYPHWYEDESRRPAACKALVTGSRVRSWLGSLCCSTRTTTRSCRVVATALSVGVRAEDHEHGGIIAVGELTTSRMRARAAWMWADSLRVGL